MATPNPERELKRLQQALRGGPPPVLVIAGPAGFFRSEAVDAVLAAVPAVAELRTVDGDQGSDGAELLDLRGGSLFGQGAWLVVRRGHRWLQEHGDDLLGVLGKLAPGCGLVLEVQKLDQPTKLAKALKKLGEVFTFRELYEEPYDRSRSPLEAELVGWVAARGRAMGVPLEPEAALLLIATVGKSPAELVAELERLGTEVGEDQRQSALSPDDLRGHLNCSFESTPFELAEAILGNDQRRALRSLHAMYRRGVKSRDGSTMDQGGLFPFVTSWLYRSLADVYAGRQLLDEGVPLGDVPGRLGVRGFVDRFKQQVRDNPQRRLRSGLLSLLACQRRLRTTGEDAQLLLERVLADWFEECEPALGGEYDP